MVPNVLDFKQRRPRFAEKRMKTFLEVTPKKVVMIFVEKDCRKKLHKTLFGEVWGNSGENPSQPKNVSAPKPMMKKAPPPPVAPLLKGQRDECRRHVSIFRRPCACYLHALFTRC